MNNSSEHYLCCLQVTSLSFVAKEVFIAAALVLGSVTWRVGVCAGVFEEQASERPSHTLTGVEGDGEGP